MAKRKRKRGGRQRPPKTDPIYVAVWNATDDAVRAVVKSHPEYFVQGSQVTAAARFSICKRIAGPLTVNLRGHLAKSFE